MAFKPVYILILGFTILVDYFAGLYIERANGKTKKLYLIGSLAANIGILVIFKYFNFLNDNFSYLFDSSDVKNPLPYISIILPLGLSFHTFQAMSYTIEVYRGNQKAERHFGIYSLYVMFYPQLVAGPIERPQNLLPQFRKKFDFDYERVTSGLRLMAWGLFKKVVIADRLAIAVDTVYDHPQEHNSLSLLIATIFFAFQIFCDFSGYSDMAIGAARIMGFKLMKNFNNPYQSRNIHEFWSRWHISLSTWFRDYLYISLGGNRVTIPRWYLNLFIVFLISGLWHGANWTFIIWGVLNGFFIIFGLITKNIRQKLSVFFNIPQLPLLSVLTTFLLIDFSWIFFRANNIDSALYIVKNLFLDFPNLINNIIHRQPMLEDLGFGRANLLISFALIGFLEVIHYLIRKKRLSEAIFVKKKKYIRWGVYYGLILAILFLGVFNDRQFVYFQF